MTFVTSDVRGAPGLRERAAWAVLALRARIQMYRIYRANLYEMQGMTARDLGDLGLNRSMLRGIAWEDAQRR